MIVWSWALSSVIMNGQPTIDIFIPDDLSEHSELYMDYRSKHGAISHASPGMILLLRILEILCVICFLPYSLVWFRLPSPRSPDFYNLSDAPLHSVILRFRSSSSSTYTSTAVITDIMICSLCYIQHYLHALYFFRNIFTHFSIIASWIDLYYFLIA